MHLLAITQTGGAILGNLPLDFDVTGAVRGAYPVTGAWGYNVIRVYAEKYFVKT